MITVAAVTISDRSSKGERSDLSGPAIKEWAQKMGFSMVEETIIPDDVSIIKSTLIQLSDRGIQLIFTTGGTGFSPRDNTPEATLAVIEKSAPGFVEAMRMKSLEITPHAMLSRAVSGIRKSSIIINLPGSPKAVKENLAIIEKAVTHAVGILQATINDCGGN